MDGPFRARRLALLPTPPHSPPPWQPSPRAPKDRSECAGRCRSATATPGRLVARARRTGSQQAGVGALLSQHLQPHHAGKHLQPRGDPQHLSRRVGNVGVLAAAVEPGEPVMSAHPECRARHLLALPSSTTTPSQACGTWVANPCAPTRYLVVLSRHLGREPARAWPIGDCPGLGPGGARRSHARGWVSRRVRRG